MKTQWFLYCPDPEDTDGSYTTTEDNGSYTGSNETTTAEGSTNTGTETTTAENANGGNETNEYVTQNTTTEEQSANTGSPDTDATSSGNSTGNGEYDTKTTGNGTGTATAEKTGTGNGTEYSNTPATAEKQSADTTAASDNYMQGDSTTTINNAETTGENATGEHGSQPGDSITHESPATENSTTGTEQESGGNTATETASHSTNTTAADSGGIPEFSQSDYEAQAKDQYDKIVQNNPGIEQTTSAAGGHSTSNEVFGEWYDKLQRLLVRLGKWSAAEQEARQFLAEYAVKMVEVLIRGYIPDNVRYQLERVGLSQTNDAPIARYDSSLPRTGSDFNATKGAPNWCAQTQSISLQKALKKHAVKVIPDWKTWTQKRTVSHDLNLQIGDYVTIVGNVTPLNGHVVCFLYQDGNTMYYISGNAGGGGMLGDGTLRIDKVTTEAPPDGYDYWKWANLILQNLTPPKIAGTNCPKSPGIIWVINAIKFSSVDFEHLDDLIGDNAAMSKMGLQKI